MQGVIQQDSELEEEHRASEDSEKNEVALVVKG